MRSFIISLKIFLFFTILTGIIYPLFVTGIAQLTFPSQANGSLILKNNVVVGSKLLGQQNDSSIFFTSRPSANSYNPLPSGGTNYGLTNSKLKEDVAERKRHFIAFNQLDSMTVVPSEMLFASASGLDPHISVNGAMLQVNRIAKARNLSSSQKQKLIQSVNAIRESPQFLCLGEERINVLLLNLKLGELVTQP